MCKLVKTIPAEGTNIREKNTQNSALLCRANKNDVFQVVQEQGGWIKIKLQNARVGYVWKAFVRTIKGHTIMADTAVVRGTEVNIRALPGTNAVILKTCKQGDRVRVLGKYDEWIKIMLDDNTEGYVYNELIVLRFNSLSTYEQNPPDYEPQVRRTTQEHVRKFSYDSKNKYYYRNNNTTVNTSRIMFTGDLMCEQKMYQAYNYGGKFLPYDIFYYVKSIFNEADLVVGNLETMVCESAPYTGEKHKINGKYHCNAPDSYLDILKYAGFDLFTMANNHNLDCGVQGIVETLEKVCEKGFLNTGLYSDPYRKDRFILIELNGIKVALLSYSTWFNRNLYRLTEEGKDLLNIYDKNRVQMDIKNSKKAGAEYVIVCMHWGIDAEYKHEFGVTQRQQAKAIADAGADYIVGSHTHSLQGFEVLKSEDDRYVPVAYSLGNFATSELNEISRTNAILTLELKKNKGKIVCNTSYLPCYVFDSFEGRRYPIVPAIDRFNENHQTEKLQKQRSLAGDIFDMQIPEYGLEINQQLSKNLILQACNCKNEIDKYDNEWYTSLRFAQDAIKGCAAFVLPITSNPKIVISDEDRKRYADIAINKGAKVLVTDKQIEQYNCIVVNDVFKAWCAVHARIRTFSDTKIIGITGSIGKTSTTEMIYKVLSASFPTHRNTGSANSVRYTGNVLQNLKKSHAMYVQEIMEGPPYGAAATISNYINPDISIITRVGTSHLEAFGSIERTAESCFGILKGMSDDGLVLINADDEFQVEFRDKLKQTYIMYGINNTQADFRAENINQTIEGITFVINYEGMKTANIHLNCIGTHNIYNALASFAVAKSLGMNDTEIITALERYETTGIRQNLVKLDNNYVFIDCYNASRESIQGALRSFDLLRCNNIKSLAIVGDVLELGDNVVDEHVKIGQSLLQSKVDKILLYGKNMEAAYHILKGKKDVFWTVDSTVLEKEISLLKNIYTLVLFKASHGMKLERIIDHVWGTWWHEEFERYDHIAQEGIYNGFQYTQYSDHIVVNGIDSKQENVHIPKSIMGKNVTGIKSSAFSNDSTIRTLKIPECIQNIRYCSFYKCDAIEKVDIPCSVKIIDRSAFSTCGGLRTVIIHEGTTDIRFRAFANCCNLEHIYLPNSLVNIEEEVFFNCKKVTIHCTKDSKGAEYAHKYNLNCQYS